MSEPDSIFDTARHLQRLVQKRDRLDLAAREAAEQLTAMIRRDQWSISDRIAWWQWSRGVRVVGFQKRMTDALGTSAQALIAWSRMDPEELAGDYHLQGTFPIGHLALPPRGTPCVYILLDCDSACLYVGQSTNVKTRLKSHWQAKVIEGCVRFEIVECDSFKQMDQLEADLIFQHKPPFNKSRRDIRLFRGAV